MLYNDQTPENHLYHKNRHIGPQGSTSGDFNAQIRNQGGEKPYPRYNMSTLKVLKIHPRKPKNLRILKPPQSKFQASKFISAQMGLKPTRGGQKMESVGVSKVLGPLSLPKKSRSTLPRLRIVQGKVCQKSASSLRT